MKEVFLFIICLFIPLLEGAFAEQIATFEDSVAKAIPISKIEIKLSGNKYSYLVNGKLAIYRDLAVKQLADSIFKFGDDMPLALIVPSSIPAEELLFWSQTAKKLAVPAMRIFVSDNSKEMLNKPDFGKSVSFDIITTD
ncbi:MAG TPA: hypothetical protein VIS74_00065 [Chthoniobacterales bacterium]